MRDAAFAQVWGVTVVSLDRVQNLKGDIDHTLRKAVKLGAVPVTTPDEERAAPQAREKAAQRAVQMIVDMSCPHYHHEVCCRCAHQRAWGAAAALIAASPAPPTHGVLPHPSPFMMFHGLSVGLQVVRQCCSLAVEKPTKEARVLLLHVLHKMEQRGGLTPKDVQKVRHAHHATSRVATRVRPRVTHPPAPPCSSHVHGAVLVAWPGLHPAH